MIELALMLGKYVDRKYLIRELEKTLNAYRLNPSEDNEEKIGHMAALVFMSFVTEGKDIQQMLKDVETQRLVAERLKAKS